MKKRKLFLLFSSFIFCGNALADFSGYSLGIGAGMVTNRNEYKLYGSETIPGTSSLNDVNESSSPKKSSAYSLLNFGYSFLLDKGFVLTLGGTYTLNETKSGYSSRYDMASNIKDHFSLYLGPGFKVTPFVLAYLKFAYHRAKIEYSSANTTDKYNHNGSGIGAGFSYALTSSLELGAEIQYIMYGKKEVRNVVDNSSDSLDISSKPRSTEYMLLLNYRF